MTFDEQFFRTEDIPVEGPGRELIGYGAHPPHVRWENDARVAVQIVLNYEEGSEKTFAMGDGVNDILYELPFALEGQRDLAVESMYEYGTRAGVWRLLRVFDGAGIPITWFASAVAVERNPEVGRAIARRGDDTAGHGFRWSNHFEMTRDEEREAIRRAVLSIERTTGSRPVGWYCREMSVNTRELVVEEGGFVYDSDYYGDDLPFWTNHNGTKHLVVPYSLVNNDGTFGNGFGPGKDFEEHLRYTFDRLYKEGETYPKMMNIGLHMRMIGHPGRAQALSNFIGYAKSFPGVWFARRIDIASHWIEHHP